MVSGVARIDNRWRVKARRLREVDDGRLDQLAGRGTKVAQLKMGNGIKEEEEKVGRPVKGSGDEIKHTETARRAQCHDDS
jgi:hypothetical protein